jgi:chemotaxis protein methyltransferase CheR
MQEILTDHSDNLSNKDFNRLSQYITSVSGIKMPPQKRTMLQSRLKKRMRELEISTYDEYCRYLFSKAGITEETPHLINSISTNKTEFFREVKHFEYLSNIILPELESQDKKHINIWSAGCATGEEVYSIAMTCEDFLNSKNSLLDYRVLGTDISTTALDIARKAIYHAEKAKNISFSHKKKYLLKSKDHEKNLVRVVPHIRNKVIFKQLNLNTINYQVNQLFDIVFCRNTLIYFDKSTQIKIIKEIIKHMSENGFLFVGHSETLVHFDSGLEMIIPTIYKKTNLY